MSTEPTYTKKNGSSRALELFILPEISLGGWEEHRLLCPGGWLVPMSQLIEVPRCSSDPWTNTFIT